MTDTIAAIATPPGMGAVGIIRISGPRAAHIAAALAGTLPRPRAAGLRRLRDREGSVLDSGLVLFFPAPRSFTGEDVVELQGHGGRASLLLVLESVLASGARLAEPGEFTRRAYLNDRIDLAQAEAVADVIEAASPRAVRAAQRSLEGVMGQALAPLGEAILTLRAWLEAHLDFPDDELGDTPLDGWLAQLAQVHEALGRLRQEAGQGVTLREGIRVAIVGAPNVGKSSLWNRLLGEERAIVTPVPGTTRDVLRDQVWIDGFAVQLVDTAGIRSSQDAIEVEGIRRGGASAVVADLLLVVDEGEPMDPAVLAATWAEAGVLAEGPGGLPPVLRVRNKIDRDRLAAGWREEGGQRWVAVSAQTGAVNDVLRRAILDRTGVAAAGEGQFLARRRHLDALDEALGALTEVLQGGASGVPWEFLAESLRRAHGALASITGSADVERLLDEIFQRFCIGK